MEAGCEGGLHTWLNFWPALNAFVPTIELRRVLAFCLALLLRRRLPFGFFENRQCDKFALQITARGVFSKNFTAAQQRWCGIEWASGEKRFLRPNASSLMIFMALLTPKSQLFIKIPAQHFAVRLSARKHSKRLAQPL